jgi:hypothetical protein
VLPVGPTAAITEVEEALMEQTSMAPPWEAMLEPGSAHHLMLLTSMATPWEVVPEPGSARHHMLKTSMATSGPLWRV